MRLDNSKGTVFYGLHFYPGVAEYQEPAKETFRVFLNENTLRAMDATFAGRPVFVQHVDDVNENLNELREEADGWVIESFFNQADGKHWAKFIAVTDRALEAIKQGWKLSNSYFPTAYGQAGQWNGVTYQKEITGGEYEHLAIVSNPRYEESVILTPEQFKRYNDDKLSELKRIANSEGTSPMKLDFFKRTKVENAVDLLAMSLVLPKSKRELTVEQLVNAMDDKEMKEKDPEQMANGDHKVEYGGAKMTVNELLAAHKAMHDELDGMKKKKADDPDEEGDPSHGDVDMKDKDVMNDDDTPDAPAPIAGGNEKKDNEDSDDEDEKKKDKKKNELEDARKKADAKKKADALRNASSRNAEEEVARVEFSGDQVNRGKTRYGS